LSDVVGDNKVRVVVFENHIGLVNEELAERNT